MQFAFDTEQLHLQDTVREFLRKSCAPAVVRAAWFAPAPASLWQGLADLGVVGMTVPEALGGAGLGALDWVRVLEEAGRAALPLPLVETTVVAAPLLAALGDAEVAGEWLPRIAAGSAIVTTRFDRDPLVAFGDTAHLVLVQGGDGDELMLVRPPLPMTRQPSVDGARRLYAIDALPGAHRTFSGPSVAAALAEALDRGALAVSAELIGLAARMLDLTVEYAKVREQFGKPIGSFQAIKHHLADALLKIEFARPLVYRAAYSTARNDPERSVHVSMAKLHAGAAATVTSKAALQSHGAIGYSFEYDLHLYMKRAWALAASWGDASFHRARVGAAIL